MKDVLTVYREMEEEKNKFLHDLTPIQKIKHENEQKHKSNQFKKQINKK